MNRKTELFQAVVRHGIIGVVREDAADAALQIARTYVQHGLAIIEITMTTPDALSIMSVLAQEFSGREVYLAAGTVRNANDAAAARRAGASILVSPHTQLQTIEYGIENDLLVVSGAATATEVIGAWEKGADIIKIYPAANFGGPSYIRTLRQPIRDIPMLAGGPVAIEDIEEYFAAGVIAVNLGASLSVPELVRTHNWDAIGDRVDIAVATIDSLRPAVVPATVH